MAKSLPEDPWKGWTCTSAWTRGPGSSGGRWRGRCGRRSGRGGCTRGRGCREPQPGRRPGDLPGDGGAGLRAADRGGVADRDDGFAVDLRPGRPDLSSFPRTDWATSVRRALAAAPYEDLDYAGPRRPAGAARRGGRLRDPGAGCPGGRRRGGDHGRVHAGPRAAGPGAAPARDADRGHLGYATPPPHAWCRALEALAEVVQGTGRSGTGNLSLSGLGFWTGRCLAWLA